MIKLYSSNFDVFILFSLFKLVHFNPYICCLQEIQLKIRDTYRLKVKGWKKIFHANGDQKKAGVAILKSDKIDFQIKAVKTDKEERF